MRSILLLLLVLFVVALAQYVPPSGSGSAAVTQISRQALGAPAATIVFSSIPATYNNLRLVLLGRSSSAVGQNDTVFLEYNLDTGANYQYQQLFTNSTVVAGAPSNNPSVAPASQSILAISDAGSTANLAGMADILIPFYAATTFDKLTRIHNRWTYTTGSTGTFGTGIIESSLLWLNTAAINSITVGLTSGANFAAGTNAVLYGEN